MEFCSRSAFEVYEVGVSVERCRSSVRRGPTLSLPSPRRVSHALRGFVLRDRAVIFRRLTLFGFRQPLEIAPPRRPPSRALFLAKTSRDSSSRLALLDVSLSAPSCRCQPYLSRKSRPRGIQCFAKPAVFLVRVAERAHHRALLVVSAFVAFPSSASGLATRPSSAFFRSARASSHSDWTLDVFPPMPWRCSP